MQNAYRLQNAQYADRVDIAGILRHVKADLHMTLGGQIVNLIRKHFGNNSNQAAGI